MIASPSSPGPWQQPPDAGQLSTVATILAVDDSAEVRELLVNALSVAGYQVRTAGSGELALAAVAASPPDLILLDIRMPGLDGLEVCRRLKASEATRPIPIILVSGNAAVDDWVAGLQLGAADYVTKPFRLEEIMSRVQTHLTLSRVNLSLAQQATALRQANEELQIEVKKRQGVEDELRQSLELAESARRGLVLALEEQRRAEEEKATLQVQLNQAQKMEAIGILAGGIAHDFNNILAVILGYADLAREEAPPGSQLAKDLQRVLNSANRAKDLVRQILAFSRQAMVDRLPINIQPLVKESLKMLRAFLPSTITIKENIPAQSGLVLADPTQIHQIVMNLCTNAFHAMEESGGELTVAVRPCRLPDEASPPVAGLLPPGDYVELLVSDTGTGIAPDIIDKIFSPYFTTKGVGKGTGMGLSISHGIVKSYGGEITVESVVGQGTTFHVYFPVSAGEARAVDELQEAPKGKGRILFVDDEVLLAEMAQGMLERLGYSVIAKHSSIEALTTFMQDPAQFDLVITDQTMPGMTGTDLARRLLMIRPELPIILCTGFSQLVSEESAKAIGIREFALKPLSKMSIGKLIKKVLSGQPE